MNKKRVGMQTIILIIFLTGIISSVEPNIFGHTESFSWEVPNGVSIELRNLTNTQDAHSVNEINDLIWFNDDGIIKGSILPENTSFYYQINVTPWINISGVKTFAKIKIKVDIMGMIISEKPINTINITIINTTNGNIIEYINNTNYNQIQNPLHTLTKNIIVTAGSQTKTHSFNVEEITSTKKTKINLIYFNTTTQTPTSLVFNTSIDIPWVLNITKKTPKFTKNHNIEEISPSTGYVFAEFIEDFYKVSYGKIFIKNNSNTKVGTTITFLNSSGKSRTVDISAKVSIQGNTVSANVLAKDTADPTYLINETYSLGGASINDQWGYTGNGYLLFYEFNSGPNGITLNYYQTDLAEKINLQGRLSNSTFA